MSLAVGGPDEWPRWVDAEYLLPRLQDMHLCVVMARFSQLVEDKQAPRNHLYSFCCFAWVPIAHHVAPCALPFFQPILPDKLYQFLYVSFSAQFNSAESYHTI